MSDKPILFSAPMVRALIDGRKTQTRRIIKFQPGDLDRPFVMDDGSWHVADSRGTHMSPLDIRFRVGDRLWVKETYTAHWGKPYDDAARRVISGRIKQDDGGHAEPSEAKPLWVYYRADNDKSPSDHLKWKSPRFAPRWASRLTLIVSDVRVQRLQEISNADAIAEGCGVVLSNPNPERTVEPFPVLAYRDLWNEINGDKPEARWEANPWIVALTFRVIKQNIDAIGDSHER